MLVQEVAPICGSSGGLRVRCVRADGQTISMLNELQVYLRSSVE